MCQSIQRWRWYFDVPNNNNIVLRVSNKSSDLSLRNIFGKKTNFCYINYDKLSRIGKTIAFSPKSNTEIRLALGIRRVGRHGNLNNKLRTVEKKTISCVYASGRCILKGWKSQTTKYVWYVKLWRLHYRETNARRNADDIKNIMHIIILS